MQKLQGWVEKGNTLVSVGGLVGTTKVQGSFPLATITVYTHLPVTVIITSIARVANVVTVTVVAGFNFVAGNQVTIAGVTDASFNGTFTILTVGATTFTYAQVLGNAADTTGTASSIQIANIYSDNDNPPTPLANPTTASAAGVWGFYVPNGGYDVVFSGVGLTPFTLSDLRAFDETTLVVDVTASPFFASTSKTATQNAAAFKAALDSMTTGILFFPVGQFLYNGAGLHIKSGITFKGSGNGATELVYSGVDAGFYLGATELADDVGFENFKITTTNVAVGWLRVGSTSQDFNEALFRNRWHISNVFAEGPTGGITAGTIGMSVTQLISHRIQNLTVKNYSRIGIVDRCGNGVWTRTRWQSFSFGLWISRKAGTGTAANGASQDVFNGIEFQGPVTAGVAGVGYGYTSEVDHQSITFTNALYESQIGGKSQGLLRIMGSNAAFFKDINGEFSAGVVPDATIIFDDGYVMPTFIGTLVPDTVGFGPITFGIPYAFIPSKAIFENCTAALNTLVVTADPILTKATIKGAITQVTHLTRTEIHDQTGMHRILGVPGYNQQSPVSGKGLEQFLQDGTFDFLTTAYNRDGAAYLNWVISTLLTRFSVGDVRIDKMLALTTETVIAAGATPTVAGANRFCLTYAAPTNITNFLNFREGQILFIRSSNANATLIASGVLRLNGAANYVMGADDTIILANNGGNWWEYGRSVN